MINKTNAAGGAPAVNDTFGPYMQAAPTNPINTLSNVVNGTAASATDCGFIYDYNAGAGTGRIWGTDNLKKAIFPE